MKRNLLIFCLLLSSTVLWGQRQRIDLGGDWKTSIGICRLPGTTDESKLGQTVVDTLVTSRLTRLHSYTEKLRYEKDIEIPKEMEGLKLMLVMERTKPSTFWFDYDSIGHFTHIYTPHKYVFGPVKAGMHHISIDIDNSLEEVPKGLPSSHAYSENTQTNWNGIIGAFYIEALPDPYIEDIKVYPDIESHSVKVIASVWSDRVARSRIDTHISSWNTTAEIKKDYTGGKVRLRKGSQEIVCTLDLGDDILLWSEFHPALYSLELALGNDYQSTHFGMRKIEADGTHLKLNGNKIFLRGKHDALVFPLTGYPPMDLESWIKVFQTAREYGINHYRYHSCAPPKAAFDAADIVGIYLQPELPMWGKVTADDIQVKEFMLDQGRRLLDFVGNSPSFMFMGLGNELGGEVDEMRNWLTIFRIRDDRHLYDFGSNNFLGWKGQLEGEDILITCRTNGPDGEFAHLRSSFSFADADNGGIINAERPKTNRDYDRAVLAASLPIIGHETGQFQFYPDFDQIEKYTGVLYPYNLKVFKKRLEDAGMGSQAKDFAKASGAFSMECYKEDIEYYLRTSSMGGFEMLDLQDYPGQGTALVGILDAFLDSKGVVTPEVFRGYCSELVPLARFDDFCINNEDGLHIDFSIANYTEDKWDKTLYWDISDGNGWKKSGSVTTPVPQGEVIKTGDVNIALGELENASKLRLRLKTGKHENYYNLWVYPHIDIETEGISVVHELDSKTEELLESGGKVLYCPGLDKIINVSVGGLFTPDYWNYSMFKGICEGNKKPISPGTLGLIMDKDHPFFDNFPSDGHSDWQWWSTARNSRPLILDNLKDYFPLIQVIDNVERCHRLGLLCEFKVGAGSLLVCMCNLDAIKGTPEGNAFTYAIIEYMKSENFSPAYNIDINSLRSLFDAEGNEMKAAEVDTAADYSLSADK